MKRKELKKVMPILTAFVEGKTIQRYHHGKGKWMDIVDHLNTTDLFIWPSDFRIKPEPTYRPFKDGAECWETVQKDGFDWVKINGDPTNLSVGIAEVNESNVVLSGSLSEEPLGYEDAFEKLTFVDGTPFGMKEE